MTGRGRPQKEKCPETKDAKGKIRPEKMKQESLPKCPGKDFTEEKQNGTIKEQKPKEQRKTNSTGETPSELSTQQEKTTKHFTGEISELQTMPPDNTKAPVQEKVKTCAGRAKKTEQSAEELIKTQPETPKDTTQDSLKTTKAKTRGKAKSPVKFAEETTKDSTNASVQITKPKMPAGKVKSPQQLAEETTKTQPETQKDTTKAKRCVGKAKTPDETNKTQPETLDTTQGCVPQDSEDKGAVDFILCKTVEKLKIKKNDRSDAKGKIRPEKMDQESLPKCPGKDFTEEKQNGTIKEQKTKEQRKTNSTKETPSVLSTQQEKTTKHFTGEISEQQTMPPDNTKAPVQEKVKTCAGRAKKTEQSAEELIKTQPETPKDTIKAKRCVGKAKTPDEMNKTQPETLDTTQGCVPQDSEDKGAVDFILCKTLEKLKIKKNDRSDAAEVINKIIKHIVTHLKQNTECFKDVEDPLRTGSYYENLKISNPDEFDVMLPIPVDRVKIEPFGDDGAFYSVALKRGKSPLRKFEEGSTLSASKMLQEFREAVKKSVKEFKEWEVTTKKKGCPAVTLITEVQSVIISLDVVLSLAVKSSWPPFTKEGLKIEGWLGTKVKQDYKRKPYYLVPKYEGKGTVEKEGVLNKDTWRLSFSHVEKAIMKNHGSEKTCCEKVGARCCRKDCLKLLKHLLSLLKERDSTFEKFCSYHTKTTFLHACCSRTKDSDWSASSLRHCFELLLKDFGAHLESGTLYNFFIPTQNLLSGPGQKRCNSLARCIREECDKGFPIFK